MVSGVPSLHPNPPPSTIKILLADGSPEGVWKVTKPNWTGVAFRFSRNTYKEVRKREEFAKPGVYVLLGDPTGAEDQREIYIGEATVVRERLNNHLGNLDFWIEAVVFVAADDFNASHAKYLEAKLLERAKAAKRANLKNTQATVGPALGEADVADMETFLAEMLVVYPILGVSAFELPKQTGSTERFVLEGKGANAEGQRSADGFLVFAGATARKSMVDSATAYPSMVALRTELMQNGVLAPEADRLKLTQDYVFSAPSLAAALLLGRTANGQKEWKTKAGQTLKAVEAEEAGPQVA